MTADVMNYRNGILYVVAAFLAALLLYFASLGPVQVLAWRACSRTTTPKARVDCERRYMTYIGPCQRCRDLSEWARVTFAGGSQQLTRIGHGLQPNTGTIRGWNDDGR